MHFRDYLYYSPYFHAYNDKNPVSYVIILEKLTATGQRWVNQLTELTFSIHYKPEKQNMIADTPSRTQENMHTNLMETSISHQTLNRKNS